MDSKTFVREFEIETNSETIYLHQKIEGDVSCVVWDAAIVLAKYLQKRFKYRENCLRGLNVIELGAGVGLSGLTAACLGANVLLTDLPNVLPLLNLNIVENKKQWSSKNGVAQSQPLSWGETSSLIKIKPDIILLADCIYYEESVDPLIKTLLELTNENTTIFLAQEMRDTKLQQNLWDQFLKLLVKNFRVNEIPLEEQDPLFRTPDIKLFTIYLQNKIL